MKEELEAATEELLHQAFAPSASTPVVGICTCDSVCHMSAASCQSFAASQSEASLFVVPDLTDIVYHMLYECCMY